MFRFHFRCQRLKLKTNKKKTKQVKTKVSGVEMFVDERPRRPARLSFQDFGRIHAAGGVPLFPEAGVTAFHKFPPIPIQCT